MKKKLLLGTTALVAAGFVTAGTAQAEDPISAGVNGYYRAAMAMISQDDEDGDLADNNQSIAIGQDTEISVNGSTTLDNGITAGFNVQIEGNNGVTVDEKHIFFRGSFGQIRIGAVESVQQAMTVFAPNGNYNFGVNSAFFLFGNGGSLVNVRTFTDGLGNEDSLKLVYFSPTMGGFRFGASFAPDDGEAGQYGGNAGNVVAELQNHRSVSGEFSTAVGPANIRAMVGYEGYTLQRCNASAATQTCEDNPETTKVGGTISFGEWSIGGGYQESDQVTDRAAGGGREREDADLGIAYWSGNMGFGLQWGQAEIGNTDGSNDSLDIYEANATYVVGPGIDIGAGVSKGEFEDGSSLADNSWTVFKMGTSLSF